jgi:hypothetical protein
VRAGSRHPTQAGPDRIETPTRPGLGWSIPAPHEGKLAASAIVDTSLKGLVLARHPSSEDRGPCHAASRVTNQPWGDRRCTRPLRRRTPCSEPARTACRERTHTSFARPVPRRIASGGTEGCAAQGSGLLRQYLPRSADLATVTPSQLDQIAAELNERPRESLGWHTPAEKFNELLAMAG